jgi:hypothetical protein
MWRLKIKDVHNHSTEFYLMLPVCFLCVVVCIVHTAINNRSNRFFNLDAFVAYATMLPLNILMTLLPSVLSLYRRRKSRVFPEKSYMRTPSRLDIQRDDLLENARAMYCAESVLFLRAVNAFNALPDDCSCDKRNKEASSIIAKFVHINSELEINIGEVLRNSVLEKCYSVSSNEHVPADIFDEAYQEILKLVAQNVALSQATGSVGLVK